MKTKLLLFLSLLGTVAFAQDPVSHPRLLMLAGDYWVSPESMFARADSVIVAFSDEVLDESPVTRDFIGRRMLGTSREALKRIFWLGYTYRVHGGEAYARKAIDEMLAVSAFPDWNPSHYLDVAEMTMGVAIGYDWLYDRMTPREREMVARAIIDKGLKPAQDEADAWFYRSENNWNSVCNTGMVYGALAVWEEDPDFCRSMLKKSLESNQLAFKAYEGGGYPEGYNYWGYGTSFQIMLEAAVESAFPERFLDFARNDKNLLASSEFIRFTSTPAGNCYSFSDSYRKANGQYMQAWMYSRTGDPTLLYPELRIMEDTDYKRLCEERLFTMYLIALGGDAPAHIDPPAGRYYQCGGTTPVFVYRSGWQSKEDAYLGVKGGLAMSSHSHLDQGSFYFEADGVTWATDLGMQDYNSLESAGVDLWDMLQDSERWTVFRIGPFSHNILTVNGKVPKVNQVIDFLRTRRPDTPSAADPAGAELYLRPMYDDDLAYYLREVLFDGRDLHIVEHLQAGDSTCVIRWAMASEADASLPHGPAEPAILLQSGPHRRELTAEFLAPYLSRFFPNAPKSGEADTPVLTPHRWPTTYDPAAPDVDGMQYLHETDVANPGTSLVGFTFTLQPHQQVVLHVRL